MTERRFKDIFGYPPAASASAPGRVNLLGEHTDYNDGYVLPAAIPQRTTVEVGLNADGEFRAYASNLNELVSWKENTGPKSGFGAYAYGCIRLLEQAGHKTAPVDVWIASDVPMGAGLSSSAALEVAVLKALRALFGLNIDNVQIAQIAQQAEIEYAGVRCGIMDQMASSLADTAHMLFLDTRTLERRLLPLPAGAMIVVIYSGVPRKLAASKYNERRSECEEAARLLGVQALRDVSKVAALEALPPLLQRRARHVVSENARVLEAAANASADRFGKLMNASHASLRDDYEVSIPALDRLVEILQAQPAVYGARLTGAGFGGACVALVRPEASSATIEAVLAEYARAGFNGTRLV